MTQATHSQTCAPEQAEEWKTFDFHGRPFEVSSHGRIRDKRTGKEKKQTRRPDGYAAATFGNGSGIIRTICTHSLMLELFVGPRPPRHVTRHLDGTRWNNVLSNLRWGTQQENIDDAKRHGAIRKGIEVTFSKLTEDDIRAVRSVTGLVMRVQVARWLHVSRTIIRQAQEWETWQHVTETMMPAQAVSYLIEKSIRLTFQIEAAFLVALRTEAVVAFEARAAKRREIP